MSKPHTNYQNYVSDDALLAAYNSYQERYKKDARESDKKLISLLATHIGRAGKPASEVSMLDIGCSTGNLLLLLRRTIGGGRFVGGDLAESSLEIARRNPELAGIEFRNMDMTKPPAGEKFDVIIANAVTVYFTWEEYAQAMRSVAQALNPGGLYLAFEWAHGFALQDIVIHETSETHPAGLKICFRPIEKVRAAMREAGFAGCDFHPFEMPFDLPPPPASGEIVSYTVRKEDGGRITMRGALAQPWCHISAVVS